jgi:RNA polymerase sigma-70 factor (ECF subfamily)
MGSGGSELNPGEDRLVAAAREGDLAAYEELIRRFQDIVYRTAYVITGGAYEADDVCQEAFMNAFGALGRFRSAAPFRPWIIRIAVNAARRRRRSAARREAVTQASAQDRTAPLSQLTSFEASAEDAVLAAEDRRAITQAVDSLADAMEDNPREKLFGGRS